MSTSPNRASNPAGKPKKTKQISLDLPTARQMLPLVKHIVSDIVGLQEKRAKLTLEQDRLDRHRRDLAWLERQRRYQVHEEVSAIEGGMAVATKELDDLGVKLLNADAGEVDFPTRINGRPAAFTWKIGEEKLTFWHYTGEAQRRAIPIDWDQPTSLRY